MSSTIAINLRTILIHVCLNYDHKSPECLIFNRKKITRRHLFWSVQCKPICTGNVFRSLNSIHVALFSASFSFFI